MLKERILDKIKEISNFLEELSEIIPQNYESYRNSFRDRASCERYFEKIVVACVELGYFIIKYKKLELPTKDKELFVILEKSKIISPVLSKKLIEAKGMRNILAHEYGKVNDQMVYESVHEEIISDIEEFLTLIEKVISEEESEKQFKIHER